MALIGFNLDPDLTSRALAAGRRSGNITFEGDPDEIGSNLEARGLNEFNEAQRRFGDVTQSVFDEASQQGLSQAVTQAGVESGEASDVREGALRRRQRGLGLNLSARQQRSQSRRLNLTRELGKASAKGATRRGFLQRAEAARRGAGALEDQAFAIEAQAEIGLTNAAGQEAIRIANEKAAKKEANASLISSVIGIGAAFLSDENMKASKRSISLLDRLKKVRVEKWKYVGQDTDHIGPYAQEFNDAFGVGQDDNSQISVIDALGVTLGAVKELSEQVNG